MLPNYTLLNQNFEILKFRKFKDTKLRKRRNVKLLNCSSAIIKPVTKEKKKYCRYEEEDTDRKLRRKRSKKRSSKSRRDSSESSIESDSYERVEDTSRQKFDSRRDESKMDKSNGTESRENLKRDDDDDDDESVSEDSLEVVVVRKSLERKCEKVVSGRRSKTPKESSKETKLTKTHRSTRRKSRSNKLKASDNGEGITDRVHSFDREQGAKESVPCAEQTPRTSIDEEKENGGSIVESRYRRDVTDSTSQETVERVVVTAMVHKDQGPDTPKSVVEASKEVTFDDRLRTEVIEVQEVSRGVGSGKMDDILEQSDVSRNDLVQKAASLKKDVEEMRQQVAQEKVQREEDSRQSQERRDSKQNRCEEGSIQDQDVKLDEDREDTKKVDDTRKDQDRVAISDGIEKKDESEKGKTLNEIVTTMSQKLTQIFERRALK